MKKQAINVVSHPWEEGSSSLLEVVVRGTFQGTGQAVHPEGEESGNSEANSIGSEESLELVTLSFVGLTSQQPSGVLERQKKTEI